MRYCILYGGEGRKARQAFKIADVLPTSTTSADVLDWLPMSMYSTHLLTVLAPDTYLIIASPQCKNFKTSKTSRTWICDVLTTKNMAYAEEWFDRWGVANYTSQTRA